MSDIATAPTPINHDLWRHLHDEHGLTLTQSELDEILRIVEPLSMSRDLLESLTFEHKDTSKFEVARTQAAKILRSSDADICRMTKLDVSAEVGQPFEARATFQGEGVKMFAAHMAEWFRENRGDNFVTIDMSDPTNGERFELTMRRANGKTPAQALADLRREIEDLRGVYEQPLDQLCAKLPNVRPDFIVEVQLLSNAALQRRVLIQADWLGSYSRSFDDLDISARIPGAGVQGARDPRNMRAIVQHMQKLLREIYDTDAAAAEELKKIGLPVDLKFAHKIEDAIGLPSTRPRKVRS